MWRWARAIDNSLERLSTALILIIFKKPKTIDSLSNCQDLKFISKGELGVTRRHRGASKFLKNDHQDCENKALDLHHCD